MQHAPHVYVCYAYDDFDDVADAFVADRGYRTAFYEDIINQNVEDDSISAADRTEFLHAMQQFEVQVDWAFDHNYHVNRVLRRFPRKIYSALNHTNGAMQFVLFVKTLEEAYTNELNLIDKMR